MSQRRRFVYLKLAVCSAILGLGTSPARGGDLNPPPGAVGPTGRFGPRTEISDTKTPGDADSLFKITEPGSYYLAGNITGVSGKSGLSIAADNVSLDLMGFSVTGTPGSINGVSVSGFRKNLSIVNGSLVGWGQFGIAAGSAESSVFGHLRVAANGSGGLDAGAGSTVTACTADGNLGFYGINVGSGCTVSQCTARSNTQVGIRADLGSVIADCTASNNGTHGIRTDSHGMVRNCVARDNTGDGFLVSNDCFLLHNVADDNGLNGDGAGIHVTSSDNRIEGNNVTGNDRGIDVDSGGNVIIKNSASGNTSNYGDIVGGNDVGPVGNAASSASPWANIQF